MDMNNNVIMGEEEVDGDKRGYRGINGDGEK